MGTDLMRRNITLGILFLVIGLFPLNYAYFLVGSPNIWLWLGVLACLQIFDTFFNIAWGCFFPKKVADVTPE